MSFSDWSNEKKKKQSQGQTAETQAARQQTSGVTAGSADTFTQWSNRKKNGTTITGYNDKEAISGWNAYQAAKNAREQQEEDKTWFEKLAGYLGGVSDTTMPTAEMSRVTESYREDTTYREPRKGWTLQQMKEFGFLYQRNPQEAWEYAEQLNNSIDAAQNEEQREQIRQDATGSAMGGALHTAGALLAAPLGLADYLNEIAEYSARGKVTEHGGLTPVEYSQAVTGGVAEHLNEQHGTLDERIPVIGGKGWGDVYGLATSIMQSSLAGKTGGQLGTLVQFFGSAAASGVQEAKNRGASDEQALLLGTLQGLAEGLAEQAGIDNLMKVGASHTWKEFAVNLLKQGGAEGLEEGLTTLMNNISEQIVMQGDSVFYTLVDNYMADGMDPEGAKKQAWLDMVNDIAFDMLGGFLSGSVHAGPQTAAETYRTGREMRTTYGEYQQELVEKGMESAEGTDTRKVAERLQDKLNAGRDLSGSDLYRIVDANKQTAAAERLTELGETGDIQALSRAIAAQTIGRELTGRERRMIARSRNAQTVLREFETGRVMEQAAEAPVEAQKPEKEVPVQTVVREEQPVQEAKAEPVKEPAATVLENRTVSKPETAPASYQQVTGKLTAEDSTEVQAEQTIEQASRAYGAQAGAMLHTYHQGQDVAKYDQAYRAAFDMGKSGVSLNYVKNSPMTAYLTDGQKELAYKAGAAAAKAEAGEQESKNKAAANGKTGHREGIVKGDGVTVKDLKDAFNDTQGMAYRYLADIAKLTGIDIVLYRSEAGAEGEFRGAQGKYDRSQPGTLYIDLNSGIRDIKDVNQLHRYMMLRTFSHEFTHFFEKWNPVQYNEFRKMVFDTMESRGEDVNRLIELKQTEGMGYEEASREVVAEAMTDILPDSSFAQTLAEKNKSIFQWFLDKLTEFVDNLKTYFRTIRGGEDAGARALKQQVGDTVKYLDEIVQMYDRIAVEAVETFQKTVAEEVVVSEMESTTDSEATGEDVTETKAETKPQEVETKVEEAEQEAEEAAETPAEETTIPPKAGTEEAKQELRRSVRMPIQGTNMEALLEGIKNRELSMESITLSGSVEGFNAEQRQHLVEKLLEGVYTDAETIRIDVPYDGKFEIVNTPGNVAKVLENLKVKARQEILFDKKTISLLTSNGDVRIVDLDGKKYLTNSYVMLPATEAAVEYAKTELKGRENQPHPEVAKAFENADNPLQDAPTEAKLGKTPVLIFNVDGKKLFFDKRLFSPLDGGKLYYADIRGTGILKSVDASGNVMGYLMGIRPNGKTEVTGEKPSNLKSYPKKKAQETAAQKEQPTQKPKSEPKPKAAPRTTAAKAPKPATVETSVKLEDFGEKIGGARKDQWSKRGLLAEDLTEMNDREREKNVKKDNVWKRPDYRKLIEGGADRSILYVRNEIRKALNQNIAYPYRVSDERKQQMQEEFVATVRTIQEMAEKVTTKAELAAMGRPWLMEHGYRTENSFTEKWRRNAALQGTNYVQTIEHLVRNWDQLSKLADKANFAVDAEKKIPSGFSIQENDNNHTWFIARGSWIVKDSFPSYDEALNYLRNAASNSKKKTRFVPQQLLEVHRKGPDYRGGKDVKGQDYLDTFGFKGGEFGNWMTEKDRRVSMNYGFDALKDLADALGIADQDISLAGNLSIAFGARGQGLSGAAAHYEQERHVINLTKMNGAGSLAHEWFHALDDFLGGYGSKFATEYGSQLPETTKAAVRHLLTTMQYRDATQEETDMAATKAYEQAKRSVTYQVSNQFGWVRRIEEGKFLESDARYYSRNPTEADVKKYHELLDKLLETGDMAVLEDLSALRKAVNGHVIPKEDRDSIGYRLHSLRPDATKNVQKMRLRSDFYNNSRRFGELHHKDGDYWDSTIEMAARAFACYVADKTGKHNDYLSAHSDTAVTLDMDKDGNVNVVRAFPVGQERVQINAAFDQLIAALKEDGFLHEQGETVKPEMIQYQRREQSGNSQNLYDGKSLYEDEDIYSYEFMIAQPDMAVVEMPSLSDVKNGNKVDQKKAIEMGLSNAMDLGRQVGENQFAIRNAYTGREIIVGTSGLSHGLSGENVNRLRTNARLAAIGGTIVQNAIPINGLKNKNRQASGTYAMACLLNSGDYHVVAIVTVEEHTSKAVGIDYVDITHSINGRILAKNIDSRSSTREMGHGQLSAPTTAIYNISIADLLDVVNKTHRSILSNDVLRFFNEERPDGGFYTDKVLHQERSEGLTDRDVLMMAAEELDTGDWTAAERDALDIFRKRLSKLEDLQSQRAEQGRLYREQQFGTNVNRAEAEKTRNRMQELDRQIRQAGNDVLDIEDKGVLKQVLQKARKVVEAEERKRGDEKLNRWRDRRNNAEAIKKYRERISKDVKELTGWVIHPDNKSAVKHIPDAVKTTVIPFLRSIDFTSKRQLKGGEATQADRNFMERLRKLEAAMANSEGAEDIYAGFTDLPPDFMEKLHGFVSDAGALVESSTGSEFVINQMTAKELKDLSDIVRDLKMHITNMNKFHVNAMFKHVYDAGDNSIDFLSGMKPAKHTGGISQYVLWQQMRPAYVFERFGKGGEAIYDGLRRGQATLAFNTRKIQEFAQKAYTAGEVKAWEKQLKTIKLASGEKITMKVSQIMSLYELYKRDQAKGHILGDGIRAATFKDAKGKKLSDTGHLLTPEDLNAMFSTLSKRQIEVADKLQKYMQETGGAWGNEVTMARFGEKQFGEENYFPINSDGRHLDVTAEENPKSASLYALLNMGFTKQTQEKARNRIVVYSIFDVFANHMASMAQYNAFALPVVDALKWFNYKVINYTSMDTMPSDWEKNYSKYYIKVGESYKKLTGEKPPDFEAGKYYNRVLAGSVRDEMDRVYGTPEESRPGSGKRGYAQNFIINIIKAFNGTEAQGTPYDSLGMQTLHRYNRAQVSYNLRVVVLQSLSITKAAQLIDYGSIMKGLKLKPEIVQKNIAEMRRYSGIATWKSLGFYDVNISRGLTALIKHDETVMDKVTDFGMDWAEKADEWTWAAIWSACKIEVMTKQKLSPKNEGFYEAVTTLFENVIYKTQVVDSVLTKNEFMRDKGFFARAVGSFMSEPTTTASMLADAYDKFQMDMQRGMSRQQAWKKNQGNIVRTAYVYGVGAVVLAAVQAVADAFRDDDDYQDLLEKWVEAFGGNLLDEAMPLNKLPIASDIWELAKELLSKMGVDTYGSAPQSVFMQWYDSLVKGVEIIYGKIAGTEDRYTWYGGVYKLLQAASGIFGVPMAAFTRELVTAWNNTVGAMAPSLKVKTYDSGEKNEIKYAWQDGWLTDEEAMQELQDKGLAKDEDEAYWTMRGWETGGSRYDALYDAVLNGGDYASALKEMTDHGYTEKEVRSQLKSQIGQWYQDGEITKQQTISMLNRYIGMDTEDITATVNKWSSKVVTGIAWNDIKDEYLTGRISQQRAIEMYVRYGGYTTEDATWTVKVWDWQDQGYERASRTMVQAYEEQIQSAGIGKKVYYDAYLFYQNSGEEDVAYSKVKECMPYIDSLPLTDEQKTALALSWWAESTVRRYKTW